MNDYVLEYFGNWDWQKTVLKGDMYSFEKQDSPENEDIDDNNQVYYIQNESPYVIVLGSKHFIINSERQTTSAQSWYIYTIDILRVMGNFGMICWDRVPNPKNFIIYPVVLVNFDVL